MLIESIIRFTLGIKDHRIVSVTYNGQELRNTLDAKKRRKLPCGICERRCHSKDILAQRRWSHAYLCKVSPFLCSTDPEGPAVLSMG